MPQGASKQLDLKSVLVIGAGPIVIGQACEFDYSGTQACLALKEEGLRVILVNSNPATIMTDTLVADATYIEPLRAECLEKIIALERPDALLSTVGGQTALNCGLELWQRGVLEKYKVRMIGANTEAIDKAENREFFNHAMQSIGLHVPKYAIVHSLDEASEALKRIGLPVVIRPSFTLGGGGGGTAYTEEEFEKIVDYGLKLSPAGQVLIDESIVGWKEYEMEVVRDKADNAIIICSIENLDPMGVHTGDSITVAPALTTTDKEFQRMRDASIAVLREIGVETGGSNVQFAVNPRTGKLVVIEMNPRVSRSSALASKATGFPIAKVAAKLAVGYTLDEVQNDVTRCTPASFEPAIDYIVTKMPRFNFEKFAATRPELSNSMRSVGEVMSIGRNFCESLQKALCSLETGLTGLNTPFVPALQEATDLKHKQQLIKKELKIFSPDRVLKVAEAFRYGIEIDEVHKITFIDPWFLNEIHKLVQLENRVREQGLPLQKSELRFLKKQGFSDARLAELAKCSEHEVLSLRHQLGIKPVYKRVDTCAAEFPSTTAYLYSCYEGDILRPPECEAQPSHRQKVVILGSGPNRIGQGIEFDYTCVHAARALKQMGLETILVNCNPETVSTDYDTSDKLYFEPLQKEYVLEIIRREQQLGDVAGVIVQFGGQTPLKLASFLQKARIPIMGTAPESIALTENRKQFGELLQRLQLPQAKWAVCERITDLASTIERYLSYPVMVRPSNVLGGRAMAILNSEKDLQNYLHTHAQFLSEGPILLDQFLSDAVEVDVDAVCDGQDVYMAGIMQHIEPAGVHSGDSACVLPPYSLSAEVLQRIRSYTHKLALEVKVCGLMNVQFAVQNNKVYVLEANPRASRTTPFVAKATGVAVSKIAAQIMAGKKLKDFIELRGRLESDAAMDAAPEAPPYYAVKEAVLPFTRFEDSDVLLGPEMKSTGEAMGWGSTLSEAILKAQQSANNALPDSGRVLISVASKTQLERVQPVAKMLSNKGFKLCWLVGAAGEPLAVGEAVAVGECLHNILNEKKLTYVEFVRQGYVQMALLLNPCAEQKALRRACVLNRICYFTTIEAARVCIQALCEGPQLGVQALQRRRLLTSYEIVKMSDPHEQKPQVDA